MQGVTILHEYKVSIDYLWEWHWYGILLFCLSALLLIFMLVLICKDYDDKAIGIFIISAFCFIAGFVPQSCGVPVYENRYKILIDDTCNITEFFDKYEVIDRQGEIYIVKEIEVTPND